VVIEHKFGYQGRRLQTVYAHLKRIDVLSGQSVEMGDPLGLIGQTGMTTGPHLHFEIRLEEGNYYTTRNPELWLAPPQGWGVLTGKVLNGYGYRLQYQKVIVKSSDTGSLWSVRSYGTATIVKSDDHYNENMVLSDLPAGIYQVIIDYFGTRYTQEVTINPGRVSFFTFRGHKGFSLQPVPTPAPETFLNPPTKTP
jgi:murein DD-endopeptidase MepM/ murein hydrolase activator NlpD